MPHDTAPTSTCCYHRLGLGGNAVGIEGQSRNMYSFEIVFSQRYSTMQRHRVDDPAECLQDGLRRSRIY